MSLRCTIDRGHGNALFSARSVRKLVSQILETQATKGYYEALVTWRVPTYKGVESRTLKVTWTAPCSRYNWTGSWTQPTGSLRALIRHISGMPADAYQSDSDPDGLSDSDDDGGERWCRRCRKWGGGDIFHIQREDIMRPWRRML